MPDVIRTQLREMSWVEVQPSRPIVTVILYVNLTANPKNDSRLT